MTEQQLRENCEVLAPAGCAKSVIVLALLSDRDGERKAKELLMAGLESVTERTDALKMRVRELEAEVANLRTVNLSLADRVAAQSELLSKQAEVNQ